MFGLLRDRLTLSILSNKLEVTRVSAIRRRCLQHNRMPLYLNNATPRFDELVEWHDRFGTGTQSLDVMVSAAWVKFAVLPWQGAQLSEDETRSYAYAMLSLRHGDIANSWSLTLSPAMSGRTRVVSAVDSRLMKSLERFGEDCGIRDINLMPMTVAIFNKLQAKIPDDSLFVVIEPDNLSIILLRKGEWAHVHNRPLPANWHVLLPKWVQDFQALKGARNLPVFVAGPTHTRPNFENFPVTWLRLPPQTGFDPRKDHDLALSLGF
ncbi:hypothetical protein HNQ59_003740 [Chitinivorax tropicus]|uniref:Uncharacterized protein n=1 Tax=Chitinivorax tropicus TaxID=714531 RepID=A0A840MZ41_9PROT|nr:hypothetical protein [Chitinivorax tropicus]MBB5020421.1 hypothetical protein [Chitinivorax tropicus]